MKAEETSQAEPRQNSFLEKLHIFLWILYPRTQPPHLVLVYYCFYLLKEH